MQPKVLVTGGAGFIGSALIPKLLGVGCRVVVLDNLSEQIHGRNAAPPQFGEGATFVKGDIRSRQTIESLLDDVGVVIHLASETGTGQSMYSISAYTETNVGGTAELLQAMLNKPMQGRKFILASSRSIYGEGAYVHPKRPDILIQPPARHRSDLDQARWEPISDDSTALIAIPTPENCPPSPGSVYAATKLAQEALVAAASDSLGLSSAILRFQNVYGEGQSMRNPYTGIISIFANRARQGIRLPVFEDGKESRDFVHVDDVCRAIVLAMEKAAPGCVRYNVGAGVPVSVMEVATRIAEHYAACPGVVCTGEYRLGDIRHCFADTTQSREVLGYEAAISFDVGLARFLAWADTQEAVQDRLDDANREMKCLGLMK